MVAASGGESNSSGQHPKLATEGPATGRFHQALGAVTIESIGKKPTGDFISFITYGGFFPDRLKHHEGFNG